MLTIEDQKISNKIIKKIHTKMHSNYIWKKSRLPWLVCLEHDPIHHKVAGSISHQGTYPGFEFNPWSGSMLEATNISLAHKSFFSVSLFPLSNINFKKLKIKRECLRQQEKVTHYIQGSTHKPISGTLAETLYATSKLMTYSSGFIKNGKQE